MERVMTNNALAPQQNIVASALNRSATKTNMLPFLMFIGYYLADQLLPVVQYVSSVYIQIMVIMLILYKVFSKRLKLTMTFLIPFLPLLLLVFISNLTARASGIESIIHILFSAVVFIIPALICFYVLANNYQKSARIIAIIATIFLVITSLSSIYGLVVDPFASKVLAMGGIEQAKLMNYYAKNIGGFSITYLIPIIIPILIASWRRRKLKLFHFVLIIVPIVYYVYKTQYATALFLLILSGLSIVFADRYSSRKFVILTIVVLLVGLFGRPVVGHFFYFVADHNSSYMISSRFNAIGDSMMGIESNTDAYVARVNVYEHDINAFKLSPLLGVVVLGGKSGGHSFVFDLMASYGLIGVTVLVLFYRQIYVYFYKPFKSQKYYGYMVWSLGTSILLAILNPTPSVLAIGLIVPLIAYILQDGKYMVQAKEGTLVGRI